MNSRRRIESFPVMDLGGQPGMGKAACSIAPFIGQMQPAQRLGRSGEGAGKEWRGGKLSGWGYGQVIPLPYP